MIATKNDLHVVCIFEGPNRICSKIGGGFGNVTIHPIENRVSVLAGNYERLYQDQVESVLSTFVECLNSDVSLENVPDLYNVIMHEIGRNDHEPAFYYHSDKGTTTLTYDKAGNLIHKATQKLTDQGVDIEYVYDYNRLKEVHYPLLPQNNVAYTYGTASNTSTNACGRLLRVDDGTGYQIFSYDRLGNISENIRTFAPKKRPMR